jgi:hypothetical protein
MKSILVLQFVVDTRKIFFKHEHEKHKQVTTAELCVGFPLGCGG